MFTLISLGTGTAFVFSAIAALFPGIFPDSFRDHHGTVAVYFEPAAVIVTLVLLGQVLELRARRQTGSAHPGLARPGSQDRAAAPATTGTKKMCRSSSVVPGDRLRVRPGEKIPVDGIVVEGDSCGR